MELFQNETALEKAELDKSAVSALTAHFLKAGEEKLKEPRSRTKKLRSWPSEAVRKNIYLETMVQETGEPPDRTALEAWKQKEARKLWASLVQSMPPECEQTVLREHAICHIAKIIANTIHLEKMYTTLKPIGERQWADASKGLKALADENALKAITEKTNTGPAKIPDWVKGAILYLSLINSKKADQMIRPGQIIDIPDSGALKAAAEWCLGTHLKIKGQPQTLEETTRFFEGWQIKRAKIDLHLAQLEIREIPQESEVPPPKDLAGNPMSWNLTWRILPIVEKEIRELADRILQNDGALSALGDSFKKKTFDRWNNAVAQRGYMRALEESHGVGERWMSRMLVFNPVDSFVSDQIKTSFPLRWVAKTESAWQLTTEDLPEPEV
jgi:hypothetical protein